MERFELDGGNPLWRLCSHDIIHDRDARCVALINPRLAEADGTPYGQIGWFEATDESAARRVLDAALAWLAERGCRTALGPMHGSTWHSYRFVTESGDTPPFLLEPSNPPTYPRWWQAHGFLPVAPAYLSSVQDNQAAIELLATGRRAAEERGYRVEHAALGDLSLVLRRVYQMSTEAFRDNPLYSDISWDEFAALYEGIERVLEPTLIHWLRGPDGEVVGFGFGLRDLTAPAPVRSIFKSMAIAPAHQGKGLASALFHEQAVQAVRLGCPVGVRALMAEGNRSFATGRKLNDVVRRYALFSRAAL